MIVKDMKVLHLVPKIESGVKPFHIGSIRCTNFVMTNYRSILTIYRARANKRLRDYCPEGNYQALRIGKTFFMSNTPAELYDSLHFVSVAYGNVLVVGLGLGLVCQQLLRNPAVQHITVLDNNEELIKSPVGDHLKEQSIQIIKGDAFTWQSMHHFDACWIDIWPCIDKEYKAEYLELKRKYREFCDYVEIWCEDEILGTNFDYNIQEWLK